MICEIVCVPRAPKCMQSELGRRCLQAGNWLLPSSRRRVLVDVPKTLSRLAPRQLLQPLPHLLSSAPTPCFLHKSRSLVWETKAACTARKLFELCNLFSVKIERKLERERCIGREVQRGQETALTFAKVRVRRSRASVNYNSSSFSILISNS